jgi:LysM repeat protein
MRTFVWGIGACALAAVAGLSSCSSGTATTATTALKVSATNYVTIPPVQSTVGPPTSAVGGIQPQHTYTIQQGDYPIGVAKKFNVNYKDLLDINGWTLDQIQAEWPGPNKTIIIPAGGTLEGQSLPTTTVAGKPAGPTTTGKAGATAKSTTTLKGGQSNCPAGSYTVAKGDYPGGVAKKFDTTVDALNAANANTKGYSSFYEGLVIVIPAKTTPNCK